MTQRLDREGKVGAVSRQQYDQWWNGGLRSAPAFHNQIGILSETSHASATPVYEDPTKFPKTFPYQEVSTSEPSAFYPSPYKGGMWHLSDSCSYIESTAWELLHTADVGRENWLYGQYRMGKQAIDAGGDTAYVIPADQPDFQTAVKMVNVLRQGDIEVEQAQSAFKVGDKTLPGGQLRRPRGAAVPRRRRRPDEQADLPGPAQPGRHARAAVRHGRLDAAVPDGRQVRQGHPVVHRQHQARRHRAGPGLQRAGDGAGRGLRARRARQ